MVLSQVRAVSKAAPLLLEQEYFTGNPIDDAATKAAVARLLNVEVPTVLKGFDESQMFQVRSEDLMSTCPQTLHGLQDIHELHVRHCSYIGMTCVSRAEQCVLERSTAASLLAPEAVERGTQAELPEQVPKHQSHLELCHMRKMPSVGQTAVPWHRHRVEGAF